MFDEEREDRERHSCDGTDVKSLSRGLRGPAP